MAITEKTKAKLTALVIKRMMQLGMMLMVGVSMSSYAGWPGFGGTSWKEEVLLHDGSMIIVARTVKRAGRHEIGQKAPYKEQSLSFIMPGTNQTLTWEDHYSEDIGSASFLPMMVDVHQGTAYVVANPMGCLAYNKLGRPNPPYVVFKYQGKEWKRIPLQELPVEIKTPNIIFSMPDIEAEKIGSSIVNAEAIQRIIQGYSQPEYRAILREPIKSGLGVTSCPDYNSPRFTSPKAPN